MAGKTENKQNTIPKYYALNIIAILHQLVGALIIGLFTILAIGASIAFHSMMQPSRHDGLMDLLTGRSRINSLLSNFGPFEWLVPCIVFAIGLAIALPQFAIAEGIKLILETSWDVREIRNELVAQPKDKDSSTLTN